MTLCQIGCAVSIAITDLQKLNINANFYLTQKFYDYVATAKNLRQLTINQQNYDKNKIAKLKKRLPHLDVQVVTRDGLKDSDDFK